MKKKLATIAIAAACALTCAFALVGCGGKENEPYYDKTYTMTGTCTVDWTGKNYVDSYGGGKTDVSQREILENNWSKIDWDKTFENNQADKDAVPHANVDEFIALFEEFEKNRFENEKGLKISVSNKEEAKLTLTLPDAWDESELGKEITMPFAETAEQYAAIKPHAEYYNLYFDGGNSNSGYHALGVYKIDDNHFFTVDFSVEKYVSKINISIDDYSVETDGDFTYLSGPEKILDTTLSAFTLYDAEGNTIWDVRYSIDFEVVKN